MKKILFAVSFALFILHNDLWYWNDPRLVAGIPIGLLYHVAFCAATSILMYFLIRYAWPQGIDAESPR